MSATNPYRATPTATRYARRMAHDDSRIQPYRCPGCRRAHLSQLDADLCCVANELSPDSLDTLAKMLGRRLGGI